MKHVQPDFHTGKTKLSYVDIRSRTFSIRIFFQISAVRTRETRRIQTPVHVLSGEAPSNF